MPALDATEGPQDAPKVLRRHKIRIADGPESVYGSRQIRRPGAVDRGSASAAAPVGLVNEQSRRQRCDTLESLNDAQRALSANSGLGCNSTVTDLAGLQSEVNHLATSAHTITSLTKTLESVAAAVNSGDHETARSQISTFVQKAVKHPLRSKKNGDRILVSETNSLVCGAANVLSGLSLP